MSDLRIAISSIADDTDVMEETRGDFSILCDGEERGKLHIAAGAPNGITINSEDAMPELFKAHFERPVPRVELDGATVTMRYPRFPLSLLQWRGSSGDITLNGSIPWSVEIDGGASGLTVDLNRIVLEGLAIDGGVTRTSATLPIPRGTVRIRIGGGASNVRLMRPRGVPVRVRIGHGVTGLRLDDQHFRAIGGETRWETPDFKSATDRYDITITGGARNFTVESY